MPGLPDGGCRRVERALRPVQDPAVRRPYGRILLRMRRISLHAAKMPGQALHEIPDERARQPARDTGAGSRGVRRAGEGPLDLSAVRAYPQHAQGSLPALRSDVVRREDHPYRWPVPFVSQQNFSYLPCASITSDDGRERATGVIANGNAVSAHAAAAARTSPVSSIPFLRSIPSRPRCHRV